MRNFNYFPQLRYAFSRPNYNYTNIINIIPQTNLYHQKFQKSESLNGINCQNKGKNNYNEHFINQGIAPKTPYLSRNYSTSFINNGNTQRLNLNQLYRANSSIGNNISFQNTSHMNLNYNDIYTNTNNSNPNQNANNSLCYIIKKNNNNINNIFYSPQKTTNNQNFNLYLKQSKSNQKLNYNHIINLNQNMNMNISHNNTYSNINANRNTNYFINIISNNKNTHNLNQQYLVNNNNNIKLDSIRKALLQNGEANTFHKKDKTESSKSSNLNANNINIKNERTIKSDEIIKIYLKNEKNEEPKENFKPREFIFIKVLGEGTYGKIFLTQWKKNNKNYAIKKEIIKGSESLIKKREKTKIVTNFIKKTGSKGVIKIYGDLYKKKGNEYYYYVLMEIAEKDWDKELFERKKKKLYYSENEIFIIMNQLIKTLSLLQKNQITHRDIKPQNVLICKGKYKISDFGEAKTLLMEGIIASRVHGTELYMSPILFNGLKSHLTQVRHNTFKSDVFSLGMCLFYASTLTFSSLCNIRELNDMKLVKEQLKKYLSGKYSVKFIDILTEMLQIEENNRPDFITLENKYCS